MQFQVHKLPLFGPMSAHALLNLLNKVRKTDKMRGYAISFYHFFATRFN